jgi:hypothetical protein
MLVKRTHVQTQQKRQQPPESANSAKWGKSPEADKQPEHGVIIVLKDSYGFIQGTQRERQLFFHFTGIEVRVCPSLLC